MGNPFFAIEILRHLVESRKIVRTDGHWTTPDEIGDLAMPDSIVETINRRVARLANRAGERVREVLTTASAMGTEIDPALLSTVLESDLDEVLELLDAASEAAPAVAVAHRRRLRLLPCARGSGAVRAAG